MEADPAEVNLTAFETRFTERRPFFLEGSSLFNIGHPNFYYSRRIGARAIGPAQDDFVDYPSATTILGAAKLTGRLPSKTSLGFLAAATSSETAELADAEFGAERSIRVAPRAYWGVARVLQEFGRNASTAGAFASWVHRDFAHDDPLAALYSRNALALAGNTLLRFKGGQYSFARKAAGRWSTAASAPSSGSSGPVPISRSVRTANTRRSIRRSRQFPGGRFSPASIASADGTGSGARTPRSTR